MRVGSSLTSRTLFLLISLLCCARSAAPHSFNNPSPRVVRLNRSNKLVVGHSQATTSLAPDFTVQVSPSPITIMFSNGSGGAQGTVALTGVNGFSGQVTLGCSPLPLVADQPDCLAFQNPVSVDSSGTAATSAIEVFTTVAGCNPDVCLLKPGSFDGRSGIFLGIGFSTLALLISFTKIVPVAQRKRSLFLALMFVTGLGISGCANNSFAPGSECGQSGFDPGTTAGTYMLTITATSGNLVHTATIQLIVPPSPTE